MSYKIINVEQNSMQWFKERLGRITGSRFPKVLELKAPLKEDIVRAIAAQGNEFDPKATIPKLLPLLSEESRFELFKQGDKKREFWKVVAERLFNVPEEDDENYGEDARDRGHRLEPEAIARFEKETGKKTSKVGLIVSEDNEGMAISPDAIVAEEITEGMEILEAVEAKNFENAHHAEAVITKKIPKELWPQMIQYFIVIDTLERLHVVFHNDNTPYEKLQYLCITIERKDVESKIEQYKQFELDTLRYIDEIVSEYAF